MRVVTSIRGNPRHWLGLLHTFQGDCNDKGDYVADTPAERYPGSGCPEGLDDSCYDQFTQGQANRMQDFYSYFRAGGGTSVGQ